MKKAQKIGAKSPPKPTKTTPEEKPTPQPIVTNTGTTNTGTVLSENMTPPATKAEPAPTQTVQTPSNTSTLKASATEANNTNKAIPFVVLGVLALAGIGFQFARKK